VGFHSQRVEYRDLNIEYRDAHKAYEKQI
jgi:hypothetical protein